MPRPSHCSCLEYSYELCNISGEFTFFHHNKKLKEWENNVMRARYVSSQSIESTTAYSME